MQIKQITVQLALALVFILLNANAAAFDGQLTQSILSTWQNITSRYVDISNRNILSIDSKVPYEYYDNIII